MENMETITSILSHLKNVGWDNEFKVNEKGNVELNGVTYDRKEVELIQTYRFEEDSDPSEQAIIYVIRTPDQKYGYSIDAYGTYSNHYNDAYSSFIADLK